MLAKWLILMALEILKISYYVNQIKVFLCDFLKGILNFTVFNTCF